VATKEDVELCVLHPVQQHVGVRLFNGLAGEADVRRIRQGIAQVAGESILAAVRSIGAKSFQP
jgi:hypothetical protein